MASRLSLSENPLAWRERRHPDIVTVRRHAAIEMIGSKTSDPTLVNLLRTALGGRDGMDIRCVREEQDED